MVGWGGRVENITGRSINHVAPLLLLLSVARRTTAPASSMGLASGINDASAQTHLSTRSVKCRGRNNDLSVDPAIPDDESDSKKQTTGLIQEPLLFQHAMCPFVAAKTTQLPLPCLRSRGIGPLHMSNETVAATIYPKRQHLYVRVSTLCTYQYVVNPT